MAVIEGNRLLWIFVSFQQPLHLRLSMIYLSIEVRPDVNDGA